MFKYKSRPNDCANVMSTDYVKFNVPECQTSIKRQRNMSPLCRRSDLKVLPEADFELSTATFYKSCITIYCQVRENSSFLITFLNLLVIEQCTKSPIVGKWNANYLHIH